MFQNLLVTRSSSFRSCLLIVFCSLIGASQAHAQLADEIVGDQGGRFRRMGELSLRNALEPTPTPTPSPTVPPASTPTVAPTPSATPTPQSCVTKDYDFCCAESDDSWLKHLAKGTLTVACYDSVGGLIGTVCSDGTIEGFIGSGVGCDYTCWSYEHSGASIPFFDGLVGEITHHGFDLAFGMSVGYCFRF